MEFQEPYKQPSIQFLDDADDIDPIQPSTRTKLLTTHKTDFTFILLMCVGILGILSFLKFGLKSVPILTVTLSLYGWTIAQSELKGFLPEEMGLKKAFGGVQISILIFLVVLQFFCGVLGTLSY